MTIVLLNSTNRHCALVLAAAIVAIGPSLTQAQASVDHRPLATTQATADIAAQIQEALKRYGTVDALAAQLSNDKGSDPVRLNARAEVALEQGELKQALDARHAELAIVPNDPALLRLTASIEEKLGQTTQAEAALATAITLTADRSERADAQLRLALLLFDDGRAPEGVRLLDNACDDDPAAATQAGVIAFLFGQHDAAARLIGRSPGEIRSALKLLQGNAALQAGKVADATAAFNQALRNETDLQDRRYTQERIVATARRAGKLGSLADDWLAQPRLPSDQLLALAGVLRELGRVPELLSLWQKQAGDPGRATVVLALRFMNEVIGASQEAGLNDQAEKVARDLLALQPDNEQTLSVVLRMLLNHQKPAEADALLAQRVAASADQPDMLERLGRLARSLGRDDAAIAAAQAMRALGNGNSVKGMLLEASVRLRSGDITAGLSLLREAGHSAKENPAELQEVATALEAAGQNADAVTLLQRCVQQSSDDATLEHLAALLVQQHRYTDAVPILQTLRHKGRSPAVRAQAGQRLLEIAVAQGSIEPLIATMRAALDAGTATEPDLSLLVDAYSRSDNAAAAAEVLKTNKLLDSKTTLSRLVVLYLRAGQLTLASSTLRELVSVDPENAVGTLERLASVELDRKQPQAASKVIDEIADRIGRGSSSFNDLMGGICDRLNQPAKAALFYRSALVANPDNADGWLLWATATAKAQKPIQATGRLLLLCTQAKDEAVFTAAVDGLLNLKAAPAALRAARREAILRAAAAPEKSMLFQVIADLSDELQDGKGVVCALDADVPMDREERPQILRELMENASSKGLLDEANACGRSMLALDDNFPPELFLQLGEQLLIAGRLQDASRAFMRASEVGSDEQVAPRAAELLEQYGHPALALRMLAPLAERKRTVLSLRQNLARLTELSGKTDAAFEDYLSTIPLADRDFIALALANASADSVPPPPPDLTVLVNGAIATAHTPAQKQKLFDELEIRVHREFDATPLNANPSTSFFQWLGELRRAGFCLGRADAVNRVDEALIARRPDLKSLTDGALAARLDQGLFDAALQFAQAHNLESKLPPGLRLGLADDQVTTIPAAVSLDDALELLPRLLAYGHIEQARKLLRDLPLVLPKEPVESVPMVIAAAVRVGDDGLATQWTTLWVRRIVEQQSPNIAKASTGSSQAVQQLWNLVQSSWHVMPAAPRVEIARQALALSDRTQGTANTTSAATLALQLAEATHMDIPNRIAVALRISPTSKADASQRLGTLAEMVTRFCLLPPGDRPEFVHRSIKQLPSDLGLAFLQRVIAQSVDPFDAYTDAALNAAAAKLPEGQSQVWSTWFTSTAHRPVLAAMATATLRCTARADDIASKIAAAVALSDEAPEQADRTAAVAIRELLAGDASGDSGDALSMRVPAPNTVNPAPATVRNLPGGVDRLMLARYAAAVISAPTRKQLLESLAAEETATPGSSIQRAWALAVRSALLDSSGRREESLEMLRQAFAIDREDREIQQAWVDRLVQDGRSAELAESFVASSPQLPRQMREPLANALRSLFRGREVPLYEKDVGQSSLTPRRVVDFMTPRATDDYIKLAEMLRVFDERSRTNSEGPSPIIQADPGGQPSDGNKGTSLFSDLAEWPGAVDDLLATLSALPQGQSVAAQLIDILAVASTNPVVAGKLVDSLTAAHQSDALNVNDRMLIERLAVVPGVKLPVTLLNEIWNDLLVDPTGDPDIWHISQCVLAQGGAHADDLQCWATVRSQITNPVRTVFASRNTTRLLPTPILGFESKALIDRVEILLNQDHIDDAEQELAALRRTGQLTNQQTECAFLWARIAGQRGDLIEFNSRVDQALTALAWAQIKQPGRVNLFNLCSVLPKRSIEQSRQDALVNILEQGIERSAKRWPADTNWTRSLAALGRWSCLHGNIATAKRLLDRSADLGLAQGIGEHQLWVADLAILVGQFDLAWAIQSRMLQDRCLPSVRIPVLLQHLDETGDRQLADRFAAMAAIYCNEPKLLQRANLSANSDVHQ